jgi:signal transduction histidine kinase/CheY-like chemotaxis protein
LVAAIVLIVIGVTVTLEARVATAIDELRNRAREATEQAAAADAVRDALTEADASQRGFLLTEQRSALDRYWGARTRLDTAIAALDALSQRTPWMRDDTLTLEGAARDRVGAMERAITLMRAGNHDAALRIVAGGGDEAIMATAMAGTARIVAHANAIRDDRMALLRARERHAAAAILIVTALGLLLLGMAALVLLAGHGRLARSEAALRLQSDRLAATIAHLRDGVAVFDARDRLLLWNPNFFAATGLPDSLALTGTPFARFAEATSGWPDAPLAASRPESPPRAVQIAIGTRTIELWRAAMPDGGQMLAATDATQRVNADASARQASKMEALGQLTGGVAHDFNNLLQVVSSNLEMIRPALAAEPDRNGSGPAALLTAALAGVERAARLTRHLLAFARRQPLAPATIDPLDLLRGMEDMLRRTLGETIAIEVVVDPAVWPIRADPPQLENAILNLAINARDAMPRGGRLRLSARNTRLDTDMPEGHADVASGEYVRIDVSDSGHGMAAETLARAMEPFFTTKPDGQGTGLGLSMVFGFARQSGGNLAIESIPGRGTTASLLIPRSSAPPESAVARPDSGERPYQARGELVLAVEDDEAVRAAAVDALASLGYRVVEAADAAAALALLQGGLRPDILFSDVVMPGPITARALADEARALYPGMAILFTSGYAHRDQSGAGVSDGPFTLLSKPWRINDLGRELREALRTATLNTARTRARRALLVEDDAMVRMITADLLTELGYEVVAHGTGEAALRALSSLGAELLVTDIGLPDMDGLEVARQAVLLSPDLAVVIASGAQNNGDEVFTFLEKPYDAARLRRAVGRAMQAAA